MERKNAWETYDKSQEKKVMKLAEQYRQFISAGKTERECVRLTEKMAREAGYISLEEALTSGDPLKPGDKVYAIHKKKLAVLFQIGTEPLEKGMNILGAHIDSPRLDLKQNPLYEDGEMALLDTHYYGGIKKYQWAQFRWHCTESLPERMERWWSLPSVRIRQIRYLVSLIF